jgi:hypothetical protein
MTILSSATIAAIFTLAAVMAAPGPTPPRKNGPSKSRGPPGPRGPKGPDGSTDGSSNSSASETGWDSANSTAPESVTASPSLSPSLSSSSLFVVSQSVDDTGLNYFGVGQTDIYGQLIVPGDGTVSKFSFLVTFPTTGVFTGKMCEWDEAVHACTGSILFTSELQSSSTALVGWIDIDVAPPVATGSGKTYCVFFDADDSSPNFDGLLQGAAIANGGYVYTNNVNDYFNQWDGVLADYASSHVTVYSYEFTGAVAPSLYTTISSDLHLVSGCSSSSNCPPADEESSSVFSFERLSIAPLTALAVAGVVVAVIARNWKKSSDFTPLAGESESNLANDHIVNNKFQMII